MESIDKNRLLFVDSTGPTHVHRRDEKTKTKIRRHVMRKIGESRRVVKRNPGLDDIVPLTRPFWDQDPLTIIDQHWPMDVFSAYGLALLCTADTKLPGSEVKAIGGFCFPFVFSTSGFLRHIGSFYASPTLLRAVHHQSLARARTMALERSMGTISCIERALANPNVNVAASDEIIRAVLAVMSFNLLALDYDQANVHLEGLRLLIAARGGIHGLEGNSDLVLMIFWVDVTASLLFNTKPNYPLPWSHMPADVPSAPRTAPPNPASKFIETIQSQKELGPTSIPSCMKDLALVAQCIESRLVERGDATWSDELFLGLGLNPIAHRLLESKNVSHLGQMAEMIRLGAILWVIWVKQRSRSYPGSSLQYLSDLCRMLCVPGGPDCDFVSEASNNASTVRFWLIAICAISSPPESHERVIAVQLMADSMQRLAINNWTDAKVRVRQMPWISAFDAAYVQIWNDLS